MDFASRCIDVGLLLPMLPLLPLLPLLPPLLLFEEAGASRIVEGTVSRCMLEGSTFVLTLFESCALPVI